LQSIDYLDHVIKGNVEVVLVFDGQNEECNRIISAWKNRTNCKNIVLSQEHSGVAAARNLGVKVSSHDIITFLDADDELLPGRFAVFPDLSSQTIIIGKQD
jgi:glycosyltransferase involved in cell wall biosynthesis